MSRFGQQMRENAIGNGISVVIGMIGAVNSIRFACWTITFERWKNVPSSTTATGSESCGFFGIGGVRVGIGFGGLGWVALAPFEIFHPWWGHGFYGGRGYFGGYRNVTV